MEPKPSQIGPYRVEAEIGRGDVAVVYRATDTLYDRTVALKVLQPHLAHDLAFVRRFVSAGRETIRLRHPSILPVYDAGQADGHTYIAMELVEGTTLAERLARANGPLDPHEALAILDQVAAGLDYAHVRGFAHHNLKPSNIFLTADGKALVADFDTGPLPPGSAQPPVYRLGSPAFMAPEQAGGEERVGAAADIYSLGAVAYAMLAGRPPFEGANPLGLLRRIVESAPARADTVNPRLAPAVVEGLALALAKTPGERPARATDLLKLLHGQAPPALPGERAVASQPSSEPPPAKPAPPQVVASPFPLKAPTMPPLPARPTFVPLAPAVAGGARLGAAARAPGAPARAPRTHGRRVSPFSTPAFAAVAVGGLAALLLLVAAVQSAGSLMARIGEPNLGEVGRVIVVDSAGRQGDGDVPLLPTVTPRPLQRVAAGALARETGSAAATPESAGEGGAGNGDGAEPPEETGNPRPTLRSAVVVDATDTPESTPTTAPTATPRPPAATYTPSSTPTPSATSPPSATPTATATPTVTNTPTPSPTPTETATATPSPTPLPPPADLSGRIAYALWNLRTDRPDVYIYDLGARIHLTPIPNRRQPDFNLWGHLAANAEGGGMDNLVQMGPNGEDPWIISAHPEDAHPHWSPDGKMLVFDSAHMGDRQHRIYLQDDPSNRDDRPPMMYQAWELFGRYPIFLADGRIAFNGCNYWEGGSICGVQVVDTQGGMPISASGWPGDVPTDNLGSRILMMSDRSGNWDIYSMNADGSDLQQLTSHPARDGLATASPDGRYIAFLTDRDGIWSVYVMRPDGSDPRRLFDLPGDFGRGEYEWFQERLTWGP